MKELSLENSSKKIALAVFRYLTVRPLCLLFYGLSWFHLYSLCQYGRLHKNIPVLALCFLFWIGYLIYGIRLWRGYDRKKCPTIFHTLLPGKGELTFIGENEQGERIEKSITVPMIRWYVERQDYCLIFLQDKGLLLVDTQKFQEEEKDFLHLKLSVSSVGIAGMTGKKAWEMAAVIFLLIVSFYGSFLVIRSGVHYHGKLAWYLDRLENRKTVELQHNNIYETGIIGILEDVGTKVKLPHTLCLASSFNLHFAADGEILTLDTMLYGFDEAGNFADSYLISYNAKRSGKIAIYLGGSENAVYDVSKDMEPLINAVSVMPLQETAAEWSGEKCFGILYYGVREWNSREGIRLLNYNGGCRMPPEGENTFSGYSISVFCPEDESITPVRYLYMGNQYLVKEAENEKEAYQADYYPPNGPREQEIQQEALKEQDNGDIVCATENIWRSCLDYPLERYGITLPTVDIYYDVNDEKIYDYSYEGFYMEGSLPNAERINEFLSKKQDETVSEWKKTGENLAENAVVKRDYGFDNSPHDTITFENITYMDEEYFSIVFLESNYIGGNKPFVSVVPYTIDLQNGSQIEDLQQIVPKEREEWIALINQAFEQTQGFCVLMQGTDYEQTAGELWYDSYEEGGWGSGFYLTKEGVAIYYGCGQIAAYQQGFIEVVIDWDDMMAEDINGELN